jgi:hypothetical protein
MKKALFIAALVLGVMMVPGCNIAPPPLKTQVEVDHAFEVVYARHEGELDLTGAVSHTVAAGNSLSAIALANYNNEFHFPLIMLASHQQVQDPDLIFPGLRLVIPDLQRNLSNASIKAHIKEYYGEIARIYDRKNDHSTAQKLRSLAASL